MLLRQLRSPLLVLLLSAAAIRFTVGEQTDGIIIGVILTLSIGLGFMNEYRAERAAAALHERLQHSVTVLRDRRPVTIAVTDLVPGDIVRLTLGQMVPADVRLLEVQGRARSNPLWLCRIIPRARACPPRCAHAASS